MKPITMCLCALGAAGVLAATMPAQAQDWHHDHDAHAHDWHHHDWHGGYAYAAPPPVYYEPPPAYYSEPPVVVTTPGVSIGINIR